MDARRFRNDSIRRLAEFRWWGCVLLAMFALVQTARGSVGPPTPPDPVRSDGTQVAPEINSAAQDRSMRCCIASTALNDVNARDLPIQTP
jgi:hypothetical protein